MELSPEPRRPRSERWADRESETLPHHELRAYWLRGVKPSDGLCVISEYNSERGRWYLTVSAPWRRPTDAEMAAIRRDFEAQRFTERPRAGRDLTRYLQFPGEDDDATGQEPTFH